MKKLNLVLDKYFELLIDYSIKIVIAGVIFSIGIWVIRQLIKNFRRLFIRRKYDEALRGFLLSVIDLALKILLVIAVVSQLGVATSSLVALLGAAGLAVGLALQGSLSNFAGGIMIILMKPFKIGDSIEGDDVAGTVKEITIFYTKIINQKNGLAVIPNGRLSNNKIINYTVEGIKKDFITIPIHHESNIPKAMEVLRQLVSEEKDILLDPAPQVVVEDMATNSLKLSIRFTAKIDVFSDIHWRIMEQARPRLEEAGIQPPNGN